MDNKPKNKGLWDLLVIGGCLAAAGLLFLIFSFGRTPGAGVIVRVEGEEVARYSLFQTDTYPLNGGTNILEIKNGEAWLSSANCPDELCVHQGVVKSDGQVITCLPNKLTVTVYGAQDDGVDFVS